MVNENIVERHALFQAIADAVACWLLVIPGDEGWAITCNDEEVAAGTRDNGSTKCGVTKYLSLMTAASRQLRAANAWRVAVPICSH